MRLQSDDARFRHVGVVQIGGNIGADVVGRHGGATADRHAGLGADGNGHHGRHRQCIYAAVGRGYDGQIIDLQQAGILQRCPHRIIDLVDRHGYTNSHAYTGLRTG